MPGETAEDISGWTIDTAMMHFSRRFTDLSEKMDERAEAQRVAMNTALAAQQLAVQAAMTSADKAVQVANSNAEKAVLKAEAANERRFEGVNEFRAQLADQAATFASKGQIELMRDSTADRVMELTKRIEMNTSRLDAMTGKSQGINAAWAVGIAVLGALLGISGFIFAIIQMVSQ